RADVQVVGRERLRLLDDAQAQLGGIDRQRFRDLVELNLLAEAALGRAVPTLRAARRLVREDAAPLKVIRRDMVGDRLQRAGVERARDAVRAVRAAVEQRPEMDAGDRPVPLDAGLEVHQHRMTPTMAVEHFFAREADLDGSIEDPCRLADADLVVEWIALAPT